MIDCRAAEVERLLLPDDAGGVMELIGIGYGNQILLLFGLVLMAAVSGLGVGEQGPGGSGIVLCPVGSSRRPWRHSGSAAAGRAPDNNGSEWCSLTRGEVSASTALKNTLLRSCTG